MSVKCCLDQRAQFKKPKNTGYQTASQGRTSFTHQQLQKKLAQSDFTIVYLLSHVPYA